VRIRRAARALLCLKLAAIGVHALVSDDLLVVGLDLCFSVALLLAIETAAWVRGRAGAIFVISGAVTTLVGLLLQVSGLRRGAPWNHNDAFHLMQVVALCLFYVGARRIGLDCSELEKPHVAALVPERAAAPRSAWR
jgi:hypothetical protein